RTGAAATPGPVAVGPRGDRGRGAAADPRRQTPPPRPVPATGRDRRLPRRSRTLARHRLGTDRAAVRHAAAPGTLAGHPPAPGHRPALRPGATARHARTRPPRGRLARIPPLPRHPRRTPA